MLLQQGTNRSYLATSEGTALEQPSAMSRLVIQGETRADDGMELLRVETFQARSPTSFRRKRSWPRRSRKSPRI